MKSLYDSKNSSLLVLFEVGKMSIMIGWVLLSIVLVFYLTFNHISSSLNSWGMPLIVALMPIIIGTIIIGIGNMKNQKVRNGVGLVLIGVSLLGIWPFIVANKELRK